MKYLFQDVLVNEAKMNDHMLGPIEKTLTFDNFDIQENERGVYYNQYIVD